MHMHDVNFEMHDDLTSYVCVNAIRHTYVITDASARKAWAAFDRSFTDFTATFWPL